MRYLVLLAAAFSFGAMFAFWLDEALPDHRNVLYGIGTKVSCRPS